MVYMSSSGLNWAPIIEAWLRKREPRVAALLRSYIENTFFKVYDWSRQNLFFKIPVLEANVVFQVTRLPLPWFVNYSKVKFIIYI